MKQIKNLLIVALLFISVIVLGQKTVSGTVLDDTGEPLPGASVLEKGTSNGTSTDFDGKFTLTTKSNEGTVVVSFVGFSNEYLNFTSGGDLGKIQLASDNMLDEIVITGGGIIDLAEDRKTPIAVSTIKASEIAIKSGNLDLPEILKETPSIQTTKGGGYGDGTMTLRGFDQTNTAFLLNGQPINGMEDGKMYWSNWQGVMDIANGIQVQRGLGSSKLAISSVGGTVNIVTKTVDTKEGGFVTGMVGNDAYYKGNAYYSTGLMDNGLAISAMVGHWQGDGYRNGTAGKGQTYFLSVGYKPNENNIFNAMVTGAPQVHGTVWEEELSNYLDSTEGRKFNSNYGYIDGEETSGLTNYYHKPVANLSWDWTINDNSSLSTVAYGSWGRGGYTYATGSLWGYKSGLDGGFDYDGQIAANEANGLSTGYLRSSMNGHNWYGALTNYSNEINENLSFNIGADYRYYNGLHFRAPTNLLGGSGVENTSTFSGTYVVDNLYGGTDPWKTLFNWNDSEEQKVGYSYEEKISYLGGFGQVEYSKDAFSTFIQGAVSNQSYQAENFYNYETATKSDKLNKLGFNIKGGLAYAITDEHKVFGNAGYYSRQPFLDNIYENLDISVDFFQPEVDNEDVLGFELGYVLDKELFNMNINLYHTTWDNRAIAQFDEDTEENTVLRGVGQTHMGAELDFDYKILPSVRLGGNVAVGDWKYNSDATYNRFSDTGDELGNGTVYLKDSKVGPAAQTTFAWNVKIEPVDDLFIELSQRFYTNMYSYMDASDAGNLSLLTEEDNAGSISLPSYSLIDLGLSYKWGFENGTSLQFVGNVNNLTNTFYIEYSETSVRGGDSWKGVSKENDVRIGFGTTWNTSVRYNF